MIMESNRSTNCASSWSDVFASIKSNHDKAYVVIYQAISLDENFRKFEAVRYYKEGIMIIDKCLELQVEPPENLDESWNQALAMIAKMKQSRSEALQRISSIISSPDYCYSIGSQHDNNDLQDAISNGNMQVLYNCPDVRVYFISPDGSVSSEMVSDYLYIMEIVNKSDFTSTYCLQIKGWTFPLIPEVSPCLRTSYKAFIFPNHNSSEPGSALGLVIGPEHDEAIKDILENVLHGIIRHDKATGAIEGSEETTVHANDTGLSATLSYGLVTGAHYVSQGLIKSAEKVGQLLNYATPHIISKLQSAKSNESLSAEHCRDIKIVKDVTCVAADITGYVAGKVGSATMALGQFLAPHIERQATQLLHSGFNYTNEEAKETVKGISSVVSGAVEGFGTIYAGLEQSASILGHNISNNTVKVVEHRYGTVASDAVGGTLDIVGNVITVGKNVSYIHPKNLVKRTVKNAGTAIVQECRLPVASTSNQSASETLIEEAHIYPDLTKFNEEINTSRGGKI